MDGREGTVRDFAARCSEIIMEAIKWAPETTRSLLQVFCFHSFAVKITPSRQKQLFARVARRRVRATRMFLRVSKKSFETKFNIAHHILFEKLALVKEVLIM